MRTTDLLTFAQPTTAHPTLELAFSEQSTTIDAAARRIRGIVVPYGVPSAPTRNGRRYRFSGPPFNASELVDMVREHDEDAVVGRLQAWEPGEDHLAASTRAFTTSAGNDALVEASEQVRTGFSIGAEANDAVLADDGVWDVSDWTARHIGLVRRPAFAGSTLTSIAASEAEPETEDDDEDDDEPETETPPPATPPVELSRRRRRPAALTFARARDTLADAIRRSPDAAFVNAALTDIVPAADAGGGFLQPQWLGELWTPVAARRDYINSIQRQALTTGTKVYGWRWVTTPVVGPYAGNKTPIPSNAATTEPVEEPISRLAGGWDVDRIFVDLGDPGFLESFFQAATRDYALKTEALVSSRLQNNATDATAPDLVGALGVIAQSLSAVGATPGFVGVASDLWGEFLAITSDQAPFWLASGSTVSLSGSDASVGGLRFFVDPNLPAGHVLGGDRQAATYYEAQPAPLRVQAVNIPNGGIDIAVFGYQAVLVNDLRAIINVTVGGVARSGSSLEEVTDPTPPSFTLAWLAPSDVKDWLRLDGDDATDDDLIRRVNGLAELYVQRCRPDAWQDATETTDRVYVPDAEIYQAAVMYAAREYRRRNSPGGIDSVTDAGAVYVSKYDSDIERALHTGTWAPPAVG